MINGYGRVRLLQEKGGVRDNVFKAIRTQYFIRMPCSDSVKLELKKQINDTLGAAVVR